MWNRVIRVAIQICVIAVIAGPLLRADETAAQKEIAALRQELEELRKENRSLREENNSLRKEVRELKESSSRSDGVDMASKDQIVGKVWEITATGRGGNKFGPFRFLAHDGNIYVDSLDSPKVGTYTEKGPNVRLDIFNSANPIGNGVCSLIQINKKPPTYVGNATNTKGLTFRVELRMLTD